MQEEALMRQSMWRRFWSIHKIRAVFKPTLKAIWATSGG